MKIEPNNIYLGDAYKLIKDMPDKSVSLIYTDIPYLYSQGGGGKSELGKRTAKKRLQLMGVDTKELNALVENESTRSKALSIGKKMNNATDMENGINYSILDEFCRVLKRIYIYIYIVANYKYYRL